MKTKLFFTLSFFYLTTIISQNLIAVQNGGIPKFYKTANEAFDNAVENDTLYFPGGTFTVNETINKRIHIIGVGHNPNLTTSTGATIFASKNTSEPQLIYTTGGGGIVTGIAFVETNNTTKNITIDADINGLTIDRVNLFNGLICREGIVKNLLLTRSVIQVFDVREVNSNGILPTGLISNNFIWNASSFSDNLRIESNFFRSPGYTNNTVIITNNCSVINNIFRRNIPISVNSKNNSFRNNVGVTLNSISITNFGNSNLSADLFEPDDIFVDYSYATSNSTYIGDFHLIDKSPLLTAANDGGQIGVYGGRFPWKDGSIPFNPYIVSKEISGTTDKYGNLNIKIEVQAQKN